MYMGNSVCTEWQIFVFNRNKKIYYKTQGTIHIHAKQAVFQESESERDEQIGYDKN